MENHERRFLRLCCRIQMIILFLVAASSLTTAQSTSSNLNNQNNGGSNIDDDGESGTVALLVLVVMCGVLFLGSFSLWIHCCFSDSPRRASYSSFRHPIIAILDARSQRGNSFNTEGSAGSGIDKAEIDAFPTISYVAARKLGLVEKGGSVECAVCLSEFKGEELLLLLPVCDHAFHPHCVGVWLANHRTCPICRADLTRSSGGGVKKEKRMDPISIDSNLAVYSSEDFEQVVLQLECGLRDNREESGSGIRTEEEAETVRSWRRLTAGELKASDSVIPIPERNNLQELPLTITDGEREKSKMKNNNDVKLKRSVSLEHLPRHTSSRRPQRGNDGGEAGAGRSCWPTAWSDRRASTSSANRLRLGWLEGDGQRDTIKGLTRPSV